MGLEAICGVDRVDWVVVFGDGGSEWVLDGGAEATEDWYGRVTVGSGVEISVDEGWETTGGGAKLNEDFIFFIGLAFSPLDIEPGFEDDLVFEGVWLSFIMVKKRRENKFLCLGFEEE